MSLQSQESHRQILVDKIPKNYNFFLHISLTIGCCLGISLISWSQIHQSTVWDWLIVVVASRFYSKSFEYWFHRGILHKQRGWPLRAFFAKHRDHHEMYHEAPAETGADPRRNMVVRSRREFFFVLMPWQAILGFFLVASAGSWLVGLVFGANWGWISYLAQAVYVGRFEIMHTLYHCPTGNRLLLYLSEFHFTHHHRRFTTWNFNFSHPPVWDWLWKTSRSRDNR